MRGNLGATMTEVGWVITAYAIGNVIIVPMTSWLSQQFGRSNYFAASIVLFTVCSFLCGNANGIWDLLLLGLSRELVVVHCSLLLKRLLQKVIRLKNGVWRRPFMG